MYINKTCPHTRNRGLAQGTGAGDRGRGRGKRLVDVTITGDREDGSTPSKSGRIGVSVARRVIGDAQERELRAGFSTCTLPSRTCDTGRGWPKLSFVQRRGTLDWRDA